MISAHGIVDALTSGNPDQSDLPLDPSIDVPDTFVRDIARTVVKKYVDSLTHGKPIFDHRVHDHGIMYSDYFQGVSTTHTHYDDAYVGAGENAYEALDDALENAASDGWDVRSVENEFDQDSPENVQNTVRENNPDMEDDDDAAFGIYCYVSLLVQGVPENVDESVDPDMMKRLMKVAIDASLATQFKFSDKGDTIIKYIGRGNTVEIPSVYKGLPVTNIGNYAFHYCTSLTNVTIPNSVTSIGNQAFRNCTSLTNVTIGNSVTSIGDLAFSSCESLTSVSIPNSVTNIGNYAFYNCTSLTNVTIGNSVTNIGDWAFQSCTSLTSITIPNSVTNIGDWAFSDTTRVIRGGVSEAADPEMMKRLVKVVPRLLG